MIQKFRENGPARLLGKMLAAAAFVFSGVVNAAVISAGTITVDVGDIFTIPVSIAGATDLQAFQFDLSYDSSLLSVVSFTDLGTDFENAATAGGGFLTGITGFDLSGTLSGVADSMSGASSGLTGNGVLVNIDFTAVNAGTSALTLSNVILDWQGSGFDIAAGSVCVRASPEDCGGGNPVPEPGTLALLAAGFAAAGLRRRGGRSSARPAVR